MTLAAAAVCPHPPLLVPEVAGGSAPRDDDLRDACRAAVGELLASGPERVVVVGDAPQTRDYHGGWDWQGFGVRDSRRNGDGQHEPLPLALAVGAWLLDGCGWSGQRRYLGVDTTLAPADAAALGRREASAPGTTALLIMGDGSASRSVGAPGFLDPRAEPFDDGVAAALAAADAAALLALSPTLAAALMVAGRVSWQVLAGAASGDRWVGQLRYAAAPYGVGYLVATWTR